MVGKTATLEDLRDAGFWKIFVGTGAGLPRFMNVPGEHLLNVMSANEFLTRVNLMQGLRDDYETPLPETEGKEVLVIGGGNTAMDAARTARRLGGNVTIVYRRTRAEMPARVEELHHALEEGIELKVLRAPVEFLGDDDDRLRHRAPRSTSWSSASPTSPAGAARSPPASTETMPADLVIMALGNAANPIIKDSEPQPAHHQVGHHRRSTTRARRRPRCPASTPAATRPAAARPPSARPATARRRRARSSATIDRARRRDHARMVASAAALHRARPRPRRRSSPRRTSPPASWSSPCTRR